MLLCKGRLLLSEEGIYSCDPNEIVEMLTELQQFELAIEISLKLNLSSSAYCLSKIIEDFNSKENQNDN